MTWKTNFKTNGYAFFPQIIPAPVITAARGAITANIRDNTDRNRQQEYENISYCPDIKGTKPLMDLLTQSSIWDLLNEMLLPGSFGHGVSQIAIRKAKNFDSKFVGDPHIDGIPTPHNGLTGQEICNFSALVGVYLTDTPHPFAGNFSVWPGSHHRLEQYFRTHGKQAMDQGMPLCDLGDPLQLNTKAGDVVLCHYQLAHSVASNISDVDRIAVYFRIWLNDIEQRRWEYITHIWSGWNI